MEIENSYIVYTKISSAFCIVSLTIMVSCKSIKFYEVKADNPQLISNTIFIGKEDLSSPKFKALKEKYQTDTIFHGETDEFKRILMLRSWISSIIQINNAGPYPGDGSCENILDYALKGNGFHCGHFMVVQNALMNAYGYVTRCLGAGPGGEDGEDWHHGINEIWLNSYHKWFLCDAKYNIHFEKNGIPLSALEIRDEYLKNKAKDLDIVRGTAKVRLTPEDIKKDTIANAETYLWIEWNRDNAKYTNWPIYSNMMIMYDDDFSRTHTWIWDGKPHWAYHTKYMNLVKDRKAIEWTPNIISSNVQIEGSKAHIELTSNTPNFKTYQMQRLPDRNWEDISNVVEIKLNKKNNEIVFRIINLAGVTGPDHRIIIESN